MRTFGDIPAVNFDAPIMNHKLIRGTGLFSIEFVQWTVDRTCAWRAPSCIAVGIAAASPSLPAQQPRQYPYPTVRDMRGVVPPGPKVAPYNSPPLGDGPFQFETYEQRHIRVSVVTKGLSHPWSVAFLPGGDLLITERVGRLRVVREGGVLRSRRRWRAFRASSRVARWRG